jgi:hypothetical protein
LINQLDKKRAGHWSALFYFYLIIPCINSRFVPNVICSNTNCVLNKLV